MPPDFLAVGHVVQDIQADGSWRLGGSVAYGSLLAARLGLNTAIVTSCAADPSPAEELLPRGVQVHAVGADVTTRMRNIYKKGVRSQRLLQQAAPITEADISPDLRGAPVVFLAPVLDELPPSVAHCFSGGLMGIGAQGWLRQVGKDGRVRPRLPTNWEAWPLLEKAGALFLSEEDLPAGEQDAALAAWSRLVPIIGFTRGELGAEIFYRGEWRHIEAVPARHVDLTGAGDIFSAAFLIRYKECADPWQAARFASAAASLIVEGKGTEHVPSREMIESRLART